MCGDFNAIFVLDDKFSGVPNLEDIRCANTFMKEWSFGAPFVGRKFTWINGQVEPIWVKLDRFLVNSVWAIHFPKVIQNSLPRLGSVMCLSDWKWVITTPIQDHSSMNYLGLLQRDFKS